MASNILIKFADIAGESKQTGFEEWIECDSFSFSCSAPVSVDGQERWDWPVSTGRSGYSTPSGNFTPFRMEEDHYSKEWDDAPMPHSIFFTKEASTFTFSSKPVTPRANVTGR